MCVVGSKAQAHAVQQAVQPICSAALRKRLNRAVSRFASLSNAPFGTHHHTGCDRMKQAIWKVAPFGDFAFRASRSGQLPLHLENPDFRPRKAALQAEFRPDGFALKRN